jgi:hypothetical protein
VSTWADLTHELDAWTDVGRPTTLWWRDDDATEPSRALDRLLRLSETHRVALTLAVIPARAAAALAGALSHLPTVTPVQHGFAHLNHAPVGSKGGELGPARPVAVNGAELTEGAGRMAALFGGRALPVLVPPWNRIDPALVDRLPRLGFRGLSCFGPRAAAEPTPGLTQVNTHLDIIDWRGSRGFVGESKALGELIGQLHARRTASVDPEEPTGLLTHHLVHDAAAWRFTETLLARATAHPAVRWLRAAELFMPKIRASRAAGADNAATA